MLVKVTENTYVNPDHIRTMSWHVCAGGIRYTVELDSEEKIYLDKLEFESLVKRLERFSLEPSEYAD